MTGRLMFVGTDGTQKKLGEGSLKLEVGAALQIGNAITVSVQSGALVISGADLLVPPTVPGALYVDENGFLKVNVPSDPTELAALLGG